MKTTIRLACFSPRNRRALAGASTATGQLTPGQIASPRLLAASLLFAILCMGTGAVAETVMLSLVNNAQVPGAGSTDFHVPSNVVAQVIYTYLPTSGTGTGARIRVSLDDAPTAYPASYGPGAIANPPIVVGPATITLSYTNASASSFGPLGLSFCTIQTTSSTSFTPSTAVVIPNDGGGPVTVILESSVDLVNWAPALPGTYGTTTSNRFFRVRAQR